MLRLMIKDGVVLTTRHFDPDFVPVFQCILDKWPQTEDGCVWITAAFANRPGFHEKYRAIDVRTKSIKGWGRDEAVRSDGLRRLGLVCQRRLGKNWDVVSHPELATLPHEHIHFEFDPEG